jgi:rhodanese-related sulfurtransferase
MVALAVAAIAYLAFGMPGMDHSTTSSHDMSGHRGHRLLAPVAFATAMAAPDRLVINVHVPAEEVELDGTDLTMAFDDIDPDTLPADRSTPLAVYCQSGSMSESAVEELIEMGFTDIAELDGGTQAWIASGRTLAASASR